MDGKLTGEISITDSQVNKAASTIRRARRGEPVEADRIERAFHVISAFRAAHQYPLAKANNGLRSMLTTEEFPVEVSQRLKRLATIVEKITLREPTLALSRMQDVGGVRAILENVDQIRRIEARIRRRRPVVGYSDYITDPRVSGYRGVHVIVTYDGRCIEIQLRTGLMHLWAITVERWSAVIGENLKQDGEHAMQQFMAVMSQAMAIDETEKPIPRTLLDEIQARRVAAAPYFEKGTV